MWAPSIEYFNQIPTVHRFFILSLFRLQFSIIKYSSFQHTVLVYVYLRWLMTCKINHIKQFPCDGVCDRGFSYPSFWQLIFLIYFFLNIETCYWKMSNETEKKGNRTAKMAILLLPNKLLFSNQNERSNLEVNQ